jgi:glucan 1,3-beta-glucosidase
MLKLVSLISMLSLGTATHIQHSIRSGQTPCRGVNLGGWLVLE